MAIGTNNHACIAPAHNHGIVVLNCDTYAELAVLTGRTIGSGDDAQTVAFTQEDVDAGIIAAVGEGAARAFYALVDYSPVTWKAQAGFTPGGDLATTADPAEQTVTGLQGKALEAPGASDDGKVPQYDHDAGEMVWAAPLALGTTAGKACEGNDSRIPDGTVTCVPLTGDIQTYVNAATAGDTLLLASGVYTITASITVDKQLNIVGHGHSGTVTNPVTPYHGTVVRCATDDVTAFLVNSSNVRIAELSIHMLGESNVGIDTAHNLVGLVFQGIDVICNGAGIQRAFTITDSDAILRDLTFHVTSSEYIATGLMFVNTAAATSDNACDCFTVTGTAIGGQYGYAFRCRNEAVDHALTLNLIACYGKAEGSSSAAVSSTSTGTPNYSRAIVNCYLCTFDGVQWDVMQGDANQMNLGGSVIVHNAISGTVTYRATMAAGTGVFGTSLSTPAISNLTSNGVVTTSGGAGTLGVAAIGTASGTICAGNDSRLPDPSFATGLAGASLNDVPHADGDGTVTWGPESGGGGGNVRPFATTAAMAASKFA